MKDIRDWLDVIVKVIVAITAIIVSYHFSLQKQQNDDLKLITELVTSTEQSKRLLGASLVYDYKIQNRISSGFYSSVVYYSIIQSDSDFQQIVAKGAVQISKNDSSIKKELDQVDAKLPIRIYFHIRQENDMKNAIQIKKWIESSPSPTGDSIIAPGIQLIPGTQSKSILKCFKKKECEKIGPRLVSLFKENGVNIELKDQSQQYEKSTLIRPNHFEVWFSSGFTGEKNNTH